MIDAPSAIPPNTTYTPLAQCSDLPPPVPPKDTYGPSPRVGRLPRPVPSKDNYDWLPLIPLPLFAGRPPVPCKDEQDTLGGGTRRPHPIPYDSEHHIAKYPRKPLRRVPAYENIKVLAGEPCVPHEHLTGTPPLQSQKRRKGGPQVPHRERESFHFDSPSVARTEKTWQLSRLIKNRSSWRKRAVKWANYNQLETIVVEEEGTVK